MNFLSLRPMLATLDVNASVEFYTEILGFTCESSFENEPGKLAWASLFRDDIEVMLRLPLHHETIEKPAFTGSIYINTDNVDEVWKGLKDRARVCYPIENFEYGMREFAIYDNNGYILQFGQEM